MPAPRRGRSATRRSGANASEHQRLYDLMIDAMLAPRDMRAADCQALIDLAATHTCARDEEDKLTPHWTGWSVGVARRALAEDELPSTPSRPVDPRTDTARIQDARRQEAEDRIL